MRKKIFDLTSNTLREMAIDMINAINTHMPHIIMEMYIAL